MKCIKHNKKEGLSAECKGSFAECKGSFADASCSFDDANFSMKILPYLSAI